MEATGGGCEGSLLPNMVVLRGDVAELKDCNPIVQTDYNFLYQINLTKKKQSKNILTKLIWTKESTVGTKTMSYPS